MCYAMIDLYASDLVRSVVQTNEIAMIDDLWKMISDLYARICYVHSYLKINYETNYVWMIL